MAFGTDDYFLVTVALFARSYENGHLVEMQTHRR